MDVKDWSKNKDIRELSEMLKAVSHPSRITIMVLLFNKSNKRMAVKDIYRTLNIAQPIISRHLSILKNVGLVRRIAEGPHTFYEVCDKSKNVKNVASCLSTLNIH
jgi:DNA-binding transcriptional ArsR family regulator